MTDLEDRLRAELAAFAQRADPALIRPLREPAIRARPRVPGWLAPAAAAGATLASARIPLLDGESPSVTGAADGRTFIIVDNTGQAPGHGYGVRFYRLRVGPDGRCCPQ